MVGNVVHYWQPNHVDQYFRSNVNQCHTILLIKIGDKFVPISDRGVKEYNTVGLSTPPTLAFASTSIDENTASPEDNEGVDDNEKDGSEEENVSTADE
jgi:hypothetical protein